MYLKSDKIYFEDGVRDGYLLIEEGKIKDFLGPENAVEDYVDYAGLRIIPGTIDTHTHGTRGYGLFASETSDPEGEVKGYLKGCAATGTTGVFPTCTPDMCKVVAKVAGEELQGARVLGIHSEGPYLNRVGEKGVKTEAPKVDMDVIKQIYEDSAGYLKLMAIAPELEGSQEVVDYLTARGVKMAYAHSNCNYEEAMAAFKNGLSVSTHTANVMSGIHHREMGGLGACLLNEEVQSEVICDGLHVAPVMLELMFKVKDHDHWMMISDSTPAAGAPLGTYKFWDFTVSINQQGFCLSDTGRLMGSTKSVLYGVSVLVNQLGMPLETVLKMSSLNAARFYGFGETKGSILVGKDADLVVIDESFEPLATYVEGVQAYDAETEKGFFKESYLKEYKLS